MRHDPAILSRRHLLSRILRSGAGAAALTMMPRGWVAQAQTTSAPAAAIARPSLAALTAGDSRAGNIFDTLKLIEPQIRAGLARKKRVLIKPNVVVVNNQLAATHVDCLEGILEFLKPLVADEILLGDSPASSQVTEGFDNYRYHELTKRYRVRFVNLDEQPVTIYHVCDQRYQPVPVRIANLLLDPDVYIISAAVMKTHDRAVCTLSLKNIVVGSAIKDKGYRWGSAGQGHNDKWLVHGGSENEAIHYNLFSLGRTLHPHLSVIDGFQGMQGNGPISGTPVDHKVAIASTDFVAADRIGVELMGFDFAKVGYLKFCSDASLGMGDLDRIELLGEQIAPHRRTYKPHDNIEKQYKWLQRA